MARCTKCGKDAGFMSSMCDACLQLDRKRLAEEAQRKMVEAAGGDGAIERRREPGFADAAAAVQLTTASTLPGFRITETVEVVTAECVMGTGMFSDFAASVADFFGGRSESTQETLRAVRRECLRQLKEEAAAAGANAVVAVRLDYSSMGPNNSLLFLVASGTAVQVAPDAA